MGVTDLNVLLIKKAIEEVIAVLEMLVEEHGIEGDIELSDEFDKDLNYFLNIQKEVNEFSNVEVFSSTIFKSIKEHVPSFDMDKLESYLNIVVARKGQEIKRIQKSVDDSNQVLSVLNYSKSESL